jgi:hypothetical protein
LPTPLHCALGEGGKTLALRPLPLPLLLLLPPWKVKKGGGVGVEGLWEGGTAPSLT